MISSSDVVGLLNKWCNEERAVTLFFRDEIDGRLMLRGLLAEVSEKVFSVSSWGSGIPAWSLSINLEGALHCSKVSFDDFVVGRFGASFNELPPSDKGSAWANRVDDGLGIDFISGAAVAVLVSGRVPLNPDAIPEG
jgi:hypothetical protein